jgi:cobalt-precorrin 5A hydrolase
MGLWVGIGCQQGVSKLTIQSAIESVFTEYNLDLATVVGLATLDRKANEPGLVEYCYESGWFLKIYSLERLNSVAVTDSPGERLLHLALACRRHAQTLRYRQRSQLVSSLVGTVSVAEAAALCAAQTDTLLVPKQKFRLVAEYGFVTVAIAQARSRI